MRRWGKSLGCAQCREAATWHACTSEWCNIDTACASRAAAGSPAYTMDGPRPAALLAAPTMPVVRLLARPAQHRRGQRTCVGMLLLVMLQMRSVAACVIADVHPRAALQSPSPISAASVLLLGCSSASKAARQGERPTARRRHAAHSSVYCSPAAAAAAASKKQCSPAASPVATSCTAHLRACAPVTMQTFCLACLPAPPPALDDSRPYSSGGSRPKQSPDTRGPTD